MKFDFNEINDFDDHIKLSIPHYEFLVEEVRAYVNTFFIDNTSYLDFGSSTCKLVNQIANDNDGYIDLAIGIEPNYNMIIQQENPNVVFKENLLESFDTCDWNGTFSVITSIFTLQFLDRYERKETLIKFKELLKDEAYLIVCERVLYDDPTIEWITSNRYLESKRSNFNDEEILDKNIKLGKTMRMKTESEFYQEMNKLGSVSTFFKSYGFVGVIVKVEK